MLIELPSLEDTINVCKTNKETFAICTSKGFWQQKASLILGVDDMKISSPKEYWEFEWEYVTPYVDPSFVFNNIEDHDMDVIKYVLKWGQKHYPNRNIPDKVSRAMIEYGIIGWTDFLNSDNIDVEMFKSFVSNYNFDKVQVKMVYVAIFGIKMHPNLRRTLLDFVLSVPEFYAKPMPCGDTLSHNLFVNAIRRNDIENIRYFVEDAGMVNLGRCRYRFAEGVFGHVENIMELKIRKNRKAKGLPTNEPISVPKNETELYLASLFSQKLAPNFWPTNKKVYT